MRKEDRISNLPDSILCHILSFLPTKYAVSTSILSKRWKLVWTSITNLCFDDRLCLEYERNHYLTNDASTRFENFVYRVLLLSRQGNINNFSIHCFKLGYLAFLKYWVSTAITRNVREIELNIEHQRVELPESIYTCKTLEVLKLNSDFIMNIPSSGVCLPNLKILRVVMRYPYDTLTEMLFSSCPVLEDLSIIGYLNNVDFVTFNISSTTLKRLTLGFENVDEEGYTEHHVVINAPNLEHLDIRDFSLVSYVVHKPHSLTKVVVDFDYETLANLEPLDFSAQYGEQLLKGVTNAKFLSMSKGALRVLDWAGVDFFPKFPNLSCLELEVGEYGWRWFPIILSSAPNLEYLVFTMDICFECGWTVPQCVPDCLLLHVNKIEIRRFEGQKYQLEMVKYLLKNSKVLKKMRIISGEMTFKEKLCQQLLMFERGSAACQVEFL